MLQLALCFSFCAALSRRQACSTDMGFEMLLQRSADLEAAHLSPAAIDCLRLGIAYATHKRVGFRQLRGGKHVLTALFGSSDASKACHNCGGLGAIDRDTTARRQNRRSIARNCTGEMFIIPIPFSPSCFESIRNTPGYQFVRVPVLCTGSDCCSHAHLSL